MLPPRVRSVGRRGETDRDQPAWREPGAARRHAPVGVICLVLILAGCTRARPFPTGVTPATALPSPVAAVAAPEPTAVVQLVEPTAGITVTSPIRLSGVAQLAPGRALAAQVFSRSPDGGLRWRGNTRLDVGSDGRFSGVVTYTLPIASPGLLELAVIDVANGRVVDRQASEIALTSTP